MRWVGCAACVIFYFCRPGPSCPCCFFDLRHIFTFAGQDPAVHVTFSTCVIFLLLRARTQLSMLLFRPASYFYFCGPGPSCPCCFFDLRHNFAFAGQDPAVHVAFLNTLLTCFDPCLRQERLHLQFSQPLLFDHRSQT